MDNAVSNVTDRNEMILNNMGLAISITNSFYLTRPSTSDDFNDLLSIAVLGLISAVDTFDASRNICFSSYACECIKNSLRQYYRRANRDKSHVVCSLDDCIGYHKDGDPKIREEYVPSDVNIENSFLERNEFSRCVNIVLNTFSSLKKVVFLYHLSCTYQYEMADILGLSQSYMSRLIKSSEKKLKSLYNSRLFKECGKYFFQILSNDSYLFRIYLPSIEICIKTERVSSALTNLLYYKFNKTAHYSEFVLPKGKDSFFAIACIVHELELN